MKKEHFEILLALTRLCEQHPEQRFGQILFNYTLIGWRMPYAGTVKDPFHYDDKEFLENINED